MPEIPLVNYDDTKDPIPAPPPPTTFTKKTYLRITIFSILLIGLLIALAYLLTRKNTPLAESIAPTPEVSPVSENAKDQLTGPKPVSKLPSSTPESTRKPTAQIVTSPTTAPTQNCVNYTGIYPYTHATSDVKIVVAPVYFPNSYDKFESHTSRIFAYEDSFKEIQKYLDHTQIQLLGKKIMTITFYLKSPVKAESVDINYLSTSPSNIQAFFREKYPTENLNDYNILVLQSYGDQQTQVSGLNYGKTIWAHKNLHENYPYTNWIDSVTTKEPYALHFFRNNQTVNMLHEILHGFGMTDNAQGSRYYTFFDGGIYDGTQNLYDIGGNGDLDQITAQTGGFQYISAEIAEQIGWSDRNNDHIIDAQQFCSLELNNF